MSIRRGAGLATISLALVALFSTRLLAIDAITALRQQVDYAKKEKDRLNKDIPTQQKNITEAQAKTDTAKADVDAQQKEVDGAREQTKAANEKVNAAREKLDGISDQLEKSQPTDSPLALAKAAFLTAKGKYQIEAARVYNSAEYKQAYDQAAQTEDRVKMADVRSQFLQADAAAAEAFRIAKEAHTAYAAIRDKLVHNDKDWQAAAEDLKTARSEATDAKKAEAAAVKKLTEAKHKQKEQLATVTRSKTMIERDQQQIKQIDSTVQQMNARIQQLQRTQYPFVH